MKARMKKRCRVYSKMREIDDLVEVDERMLDHLVLHDKAEKFIAPEPKKRMTRMRTPEQKTITPRITDPGVDNDARSPVDS